jgi:RND family efflux transporter MFP subunit
MRRSLIILGVLIAALVAAPGCKKEEAAQAAAGRKGRGGKGIEFPVETMVVESSLMDYVVNAPGVIEAFERVQVTARVAGVVDKISFTEGGDVKKDQVLAVIDSRRYALAVSQAKASVEKAEATEADVEKSLARRKAASESNPGLIPGEEIEGYITKGRTARADVNQNRELLKAAQVNLTDSFVRAPIGGVIQSRTVETGQYVQAGTVLATLLQRDPLLLRFQVTTQDAARLKPTLPVTFTLRESTRVYDAKITLVAAAADPKSHLVSVTAEVDDREHKFWVRPGAFAEVKILVGAARAVPLIPQIAVRPSERGFLVYVVENGIAKEKILKLGMHSEDGRVEVKDGLSAGETLVLRGAEPLSDGAKVRVVPPGGTVAVGRGAKGSASAEGDPSGPPANPPAGDAPAGSGRTRPEGSGRRRGGAAPTPSTGAAP